MALPPTPSGVMRFRLVHEQPNADHVGSHFDLRYGGTAPSTGDLTVLAGDCVGAWATHLESFLSESALLFEVTAVDLANPSTPQGLSSATAGGTRTGAPLPNNIAATIVDTIDRRYRGSRPKRFLPFFTETDVSSTTTWLTGSVDALNTAWAAFIGEMGTQSSGGCVLGAPVGVSYFSGSIANPNPRGRLQRIPAPRDVPALFAVLSSACDPRFGSQRRRLTAA